MALESLAGISAALAQTAAPKLTRAWNRLAVLLQNIEIRSGGGAGGGQNVAWDVAFSGAKTYGFSEGADIDSKQYTTDPPVKAVLPWGQYQSAFQLSHLEVNAAMANIANAVELENIFGERLFDAAASIVDTINTDIWSGTGITLDVNSNAVPGIIGLDTALAKTGVYAGISKAVYPEWAGNVRANGGVDRALTMKLLAQLEQDIYTASGMDPDFLGCDPAIHTAYESLFEPTRRTVDEGGAPIAAYNGSAPRMNWRGNPITRDRRATIKRLYQLRRDGIGLHVLPWATLAGNPEIPGREIPGPSSNGATSTNTGLQLHVYPIAKTGSSYKFVAEVYCQLCVRRPNEHGFISDISES